MPPSPTRLDPDGYYACLGIEPAASRATVVSAFRAKARLLHPDVPVTGDSEAFVAVKRAYDVLSNPDLRNAYDRKARVIPQPPVMEPEVAAAVRRTAYRPSAFFRPAAFRPTGASSGGADGMSARRLVFPGVPLGVWVALGVFLCLSLYEAGSHLLSPLPVNNAGIRPNAQSVAPLSQADHLAVLYGPAPVRLAGTPNFYVVPAGTPAVIWRLDPERNVLVPLAQLPPFSAVQAVRIIRQSGMLEVLVDGQANGFISAARLAPGDLSAARNAYCGYNSGPAPTDAEVLERSGHGNGMVHIDNRAVQPVVLKLRDAAGAVIASVFLNPGSHADLGDLPAGTYRPEFAIGELWSRACNAFAAGMRARRMQASITVPGSDRIEIAAAADKTTEISDQAFAKE